MKTLTEADIIRVMREEWDGRVNMLTEALDAVMTAKVEDKDMPVLTPELKVMHKKSRIRYTICSVGPRDCILRTPEGKTFLVDAQTMENDYEIA